ncbi:ATP-binding protein [Gallibacterium anatis]|uniref:ATP-binding protein n=1 Tax=Gallibacterium anatis TaxID=750 RepID=UPI0039FC128E
MNKGSEELDIKLDGKDEITEINFLLQKYTEILKDKNRISKNLQQTQNELIQAAKLAIVGKTMTTLAHEINQPLNVLSIYIFSLKKMVMQKSYNQFSSYIDKIESQIERINRIIKGLRQFSRKNVNSDMQLTPIKSIIYDAWELIEIQYKSKKSSLKLYGDADVFVDKGLLEQVFINLFSNAFEACNDIVEINIEILKNDKNIQVSVSDNGTGWPEDDSEKLLSPFYTNKEIGLGLGLTICQRIMKQFNGDLMLASNLKRGAVVILKFNNTIGK